MQVTMENQHPLQIDLLELIGRRGPLTRDQMVQTLNRARTTIYDNLKVLISQDKVKKFSRHVNARGRPVVFFDLKR